MTAYSIGVEMCRRDDPVPLDTRLVSPGVREAAE